MIRPLLKQRLRVRHKRKAALSGLKPDAQLSQHMPATEPQRARAPVYCRVQGA